jgi:hypothetical protein
MLEAMGKDKSEFTPADGPEIDTLFLIDRGRSTALFVKAHFNSRKFSTDRKFSENIIVKTENFQLQNFFTTENLCRPITFYKFFFSRKIFCTPYAPVLLVCKIIVVFCGSLQQFSTIRRYF